MGKRRNCSLTAIILSSILFSPNDYYGRLAHFIKLASVISYYNHLYEFPAILPFENTFPVHHFNIYIYIASTNKDILPSFKLSICMHWRKQMCVLLLSTLVIVTHKAFLVVRTFANIYIQHPSRL